MRTRMKGTVLLTGARAPAALEWARQLSGAGWRVFAADSIPHPLASWSCSVSETWRVPRARQEPKNFVRAVSDICRSQKVDLVVPVCEEIFHLSQGAHQLPAHTRLWAEPFDRLRQLHDKNAFAAFASKLSLPVPETNLITSEDAVRELNGEWFLKPCFSRFAITGRRWFGAAGQKSKAEAWLCKQEISPLRPWVAQEFLAGQGWCAYALAEAGQV